MRRLPSWSRTVSGGQRRLRGVVLGPGDEVGTHLLGPARRRATPLWRPPARTTPPGCPWWRSAPCGAGRSAPRPGPPGVGARGVPPTGRPTTTTARRQALEVPLPGPRRGLVEVVDVEQQPALGRGEDAEVAPVGVPAQLHVYARGRGRRQIDRHHPRRPPQEGEGRLEHAAPAHRHEARDASGVLGRRARVDGIGPTRGRLPDAVARAGHDRRAADAPPGGPGLSRCPLPPRRPTALHRRGAAHQADGRRRQTPIAPAGPARPRREALVLRRRRAPARPAHGQSLRR